MDRKRLVNLVVGCLCLLTAQAALAEEAKTVTQPDPALAALFSSTGGSCSALVLQEPKTDAERQRNAQTKAAFLAQRLGAVSVCAVSTTGSQPDVLSTLAAGVNTCGDCGNCFSAAACENCALGAVCSGPGVVPVRACRSVKACGGNLFCCGCS